ncbi:hypothetical protein ACA910_020229 [Epithemia clementina (nom. ined.)]
MVAAAATTTTASWLYTIYASCLVAPYLLLFFGTWLVVSLARPLLVLTVLSAIVMHPQSALRKFELLVTTVAYLLFSQDKRWKAPPVDPATYFPSNNNNDKNADNNKNANTTGTRAAMDKKTIIFVRHGESTWNDTFNKGDRKPLQFVAGFVPGLCHALFMEWYFYVTGQASESWFYDAPLSPKGLQQAQNIRAYLAKACTDLEFLPKKEQELVKLLLGVVEEEAEAEVTANGNGTTEDNTEPKVRRRKSQLVSSNLRRCVATMAVGFADRLKKSRDEDENIVDMDNDTDRKEGTAACSSSDSILLLPELQEISFNPDALCITPPYQVPAVAFTDPRSLVQQTYQTQLNIQYHTGNKQLFNNNKNNNNNVPVNTGLHRLQAFCRLVFDPSVIASTKTAVICGGHSLWFRSFFRTYLPYSFEHVSKKKKLTNGSIVAFTLQRIMPVTTTMTTNGATTATTKNTTSTTTTTKESGDTQSTSDSTMDPYQYMIDPSSIVVLHGGF